MKGTVERRIGCPRTKRRIASGDMCGSLPAPHVLMEIDSKDIMRIIVTPKVYKVSFININYEFE